MQLGIRLFQHYWHLACHRKELPNDGDFVKLKTPIGDVVVFNDAGEYIAFDNRCAHRGATIYLTDSGNQANTCKYHGWTFRSGKLIIPGVDTFKDCNIGRADLRRYKLDWCGDFLFVGVEPLHALSEQLAGITDTLENIAFNINRRLDLNTYEYECAWPIAVENALEPYHIDMVHPASLAALKLQEGTNTFHGLNSIWQTQVGDARIKKQLDKLATFFNIDYSFPGYMNIFMFPFTMISSTYGYSYSLQNFFPSQVRQDRTHFMSRLLTCNLRDERAEKIIHPFFESSAKINRQVFEEDHAICKILPADAWSPEPLAFISEEEIRIAHFRRLCRS